MTKSISNQSYIRYDSILDNRFSVEEGNQIITLFCKPNVKGIGDSVFYIIEKLNSSGKTVLARYDYVQDPVNSEQYLIDFSEEVIEDEKERKTSLLNMLGTQTLKIGSWCITSNKGTMLHKFIMDSEKDQKFNNSQMGVHPYGFEPHTYMPFSHPRKRESFLDSKGFLWARTLLDNFDFEHMGSDIEECKTYRPYNPWNISSLSTDSERQLKEYQETHKAFKQAIDYLPKTKEYENIVTHLRILEKELKTEEHCTPLNLFVLKSFTNYTKKLPNVGNEKLILHRTQVLSDRLEEKAEEYKHTAPMSKSLKSAISGVIGAVVGFVLGTVVSGPICGLMLGGLGGIAGTSFGFFNFTKKNEQYKAGLKSLDLAKDTVNSMIRNNP